MADGENLDIMICIHYSDWWADPSNQTKPAAWVGLSVSQLETAVYNHTSDILNALGNENIVPKWVQIGKSDLSNVEVINGLNKGDEVYVLPSQSLVDYQEKFRARVSSSFGG